MKIRELLRDGNYIKGLKLYLTAILMMGLIFISQGYILAVEPFRGLAQWEVPTKITFSEGRNTYCYSLEDLGLEITCNWEGEVFSGYLLTCRDEEKLLQGLKRLAAFIDLSPRNAAFRLDDQGQLIITPANEGREVNQKTLYTTLTSKNHYQENYPLLIKVLKPQISVTDLQDKQPDTLWASYTTALSNIPDRTENVRLASSFLDGLVLTPGQEFSFNDQVGPREKERGFREAMIISEGSFTPGLGGGICQVSSTLYNVALLAGMEITERHPHSVRIAYVPVGRDATVYYGTKDFKFRNNTESFIMLRAKVVGLKLEIGIYGENN